MIVALIMLRVPDAELAPLAIARIPGQACLSGGGVKTLLPRGIGPVRVIHPGRNESSMQKAIYPSCDWRATFVVATNESMGSRSVPAISVHVRVVGAPRTLLHIDG